MPTAASDVPSDMPPARPRGFMTGPGHGEPLAAAGGYLLAGSPATYGRLTVIESSAPPGDETPLHIHAAMDEAFYVLSGEYAIRCGDDTFTATSGCFVYLPHGVPHAYRAGPDGGRQLVLGLPGGLDGFFREMAHAEDIAELGHRYGVTFL